MKTGDIWMRKILSFLDSWIHFSLCRIALLKPQIQPSALGSIFQWFMKRESMKAELCDFEAQVVAYAALAYCSTTLTLILARG